MSILGYNYSLFLLYAKMINSIVENREILYFSDMYIISQIVVFCCCMVFINLPYNRPDNFTDNWAVQKPVEAQFIHYH